MSSKKGTSNNSGSSGGGQDRGQNVTHKDIAKEQRKQREKRKQTALEQGKKEVQSAIEKSGSDMYGGVASQTTNEFLADPKHKGEYAKVGSHFVQEGGNFIRVDEAGKELKYGKSGMAMGSGDPTGIMSSTAISEKMFNKQKNIQTAIGLGISLFSGIPIVGGAIAAEAQSKQYSQYLNKFSTTQNKSASSFTAPNVTTGDASSAWSGDAYSSEAGNQVVMDNTEKERIEKLQAISSVSAAAQKDRKFLTATSQVFGGTFV
jgi:hypothetical protein